MYTKMKNLTVALTLGIFALTSPIWAQGMGNPGGNGGPGGGGHGGGMHDGDGDGDCMHDDSLVTVTVTGTVFTEMVLVDPDCDSSFTGPGHHHGPGMGGPGSCDSLGFGDWDSTFFGGFGGFHHGNEYAGIHPQGNMNHVSASQTAGYALREDGPDSLIYHTVYFLDVDGDSLMDYVLNFGPDWYQPVDSTLTRPEAGDTITVTGIQMMESPNWEMDVLIVLELNGGIWREFGPMGPGHGDPQVPGMSHIRNQTIGENQNFPNPFNPTTTISFNILEAGQVNVMIYDITGRVVKALVVDQYSTPGLYNVTWNGTDASGLSVASGLYMYRITMGTNQVNRMITFLK